MRDVYKVYIKVLLATGIPFSLIMGLFMGFIFILFNGIQKSLIVGVLVGVVLGAAFGILMSLIVSTTHVKSINKILPNDRKNKYSVRPISYIDVTEPVDITYDYCLSRVKNGVDWSIYDQESAVRIIFKTSLTMKSFGEIITITFKGYDDNVTKIEVASKPKLPTTIIDYGKNLENVLMVERLLNGVSIA